MSCAHLESTPIDAVPVPSELGGCPECVALDFTGWIHLRMCLTCGNIACCDSSPHRHASKHHADSGHPVMRSVEPGEFWRWCYEDDDLA